MNIIPNLEEDSFSERLGLALGQAGSNLAQGLVQQNLQKQESMALAKALGLDSNAFKNISPDMQKSFAQSLMRQQEEASKQKYKSELGTVSPQQYQEYSDLWGEERAKQFALLPKSVQKQVFDRYTGFLDFGYSPQQAIDRAISGEEGKEAVDKEDLSVKEKAFFKKNPERTKQIIDLQKSYDIPIYSKKPKDFAGSPSDLKKKIDRNEQENKKNLEPMRERLRAAESDARDIQALENLNQSLPEGLKKAIIVDKDTGKLRPSAQLTEISPVSAQLLEKINARFAGKAQKSFGARVTNFELDTFMKQFPSLLNSAEGRAAITRMMKINLELDNLYDKAYRDVLDFYGARKIDPEDADLLAREMIAERTEELVDEYNMLTTEAETIDRQGRTESERIEQGDQVDIQENEVIVIGPDGTRYAIDRTEIDALPQGYEVAK
jgi:hypothetical protein